MYKLMPLDLINAYVEYRKSKFDHPPTGNNDRLEERIFIHDSLVRQRANNQQGHNIKRESDLNQTQIYPKKTPLCHENPSRGTYLLLGKAPQLK